MKVDPAAQEARTGAANARRRLDFRTLPRVLGGLAVGAGLALFAALLGDWRATPGVLLGLMGLGAALGAAPLTRRLLYGGAGGLALLVAVCLLTPVLRGPLDRLIVRDAPARADAIVVLGARVQCGTADPGAALLARLTRGLELWRSGYAPRLTLSEQSDVLGPDCVKMDVVQRNLVRRLYPVGGYPVGGPELLRLADVTTTRDEADRTLALARRLGWKRVILVTSPWHSRRAKALFEGRGLEALSVPAPETGFDLTLPQPDDRLAALRVVLYEGLSRLKARVGGAPPAQAQAQCERCVTLP